LRDPWERLQHAAGAGKAAATALKLTDQQGAAAVVESLGQIAHCDPRALVQANGCHKARVMQRMLVEVDHRDIGLEQAPQQ
jgi:hypothetical protein